jgi:cytochrome c oxidase assembly protein subunit 15
MAERAILHRWSVALVVCTFLLIIAGGLVTSRDAGLAVPDWPLSYGTLNPPRWYAIENVRTEHGHRLIAGCVALLTVVVAWRARRLESRRSVRRLAFAAVAAVLAQALLGGLRVLALSVDLAMVHGWLAQMFLCIAVSLAVTTSRSWPPKAQDAPLSSHVAAVAAVILVIAQLVVGIFIRHAGVAVRPLATSPLFYVHVLGAMAVLATAVLMASSASARSASPYIAQRTRLLVGLIATQIVLGLATWIATEPSATGRSATALEAWLPTLHVATGAGVLATAWSIALHALANSRTVPQLHGSMAEARR